MDEQLAEVEWPEVPFPLRESLILVGRRGSEAHNTYVPPTDPDAIDDRDLLGICVPPVEYILGLERFDHAESIKGVWDVVLYDLRKFVNLLTLQNPNVLSLLWLRPEDYLLVTPEGQRLIDARQLFRAKGPAYHSFTGYAYGQLKRMTHFGPNAFSGYMGAKRKALVERYGYDTKNAAHMIRLLHMGEEYLQTGDLTVFRTNDREMILQIKRGEWPLPAVQLHAEACFKRCKIACDESPLPTRIDRQAVNALVTATLRRYV